MPHDKFNKFVEEQSTQSRVSEVEKEKRLEEWIKQIQKFYKTVVSYLNPYVEKETIRLQRRKKKIFEQIIGEYETETMLISVGSNELILDPIGRYVIGAYGRIDLHGPAGNIRFVLVTKESTVGKSTTTDKHKSTKSKTAAELTWSIATKGVPMKCLPLTADSFFNAVMEVSNG